MDGHATTGASSGKRIYYLRILAMYVCLAACVLGTVLWQKSYSHHLVLIKFDADGERIMNSRVTSIAGQVSIFVTNDTGWSITDWNFLSLVADSESKAMAAQVKAQQGWLGFSTRRGYLGRPKRTVTFPHWAFCLTAGFIALLFKPAPRFKVRLSGLLIATSIFAVLVACVHIGSGRQAKPESHREVVQAALIRLLSRPSGSFVIIEAAQSGKFVQFAWSKEQHLSFDLPSQTLSPEEMTKAKDVFSDLGYPGPETHQVLEFPGGPPAGEQTGFTVRFGQDIDKASQLAVVILHRVYGLNENAKLVLTEK